MPRASFGDVITGWDTLIDATEANLADLAHLEPILSQLASAASFAREAHVRQAASKAQAQQATRDVEGFFAEGQDLATRLRNGIRQRYGLRSEKLTEFGMKPRRKKTKPEPTAPPAPAPSPTPESDPPTPVPE